MDHVRISPRLNGTRRFSDKLPKIEASSMLVWRELRRFCAKSRNRSQSEWRFSAIFQDPGIEACNPRPRDCGDNRPSGDHPLAGKRRQGARSARRGRPRPDLPAKDRFAPHPRYPHGHTIFGASGASSHNRLLAALDAGGRFTLVSGRQVIAARLGPARAVRAPRPLQLQQRIRVSRSRRHEPRRFATSENCASCCRYLVTKDRWPTIYRHHPKIMIVATGRGIRQAGSKPPARRMRAGPAAWPPFPLAADPRPDKMRPDRDTSSCGPTATHIMRLAATDNAGRRPETRKGPLG